MNTDLIESNLDIQVLDLRTTIQTLEMDGKNLVVNDVETQGQATSLRSQVRDLEKKVKFREDALSQLPAVQLYEKTCKAIRETKKWLKDIDGNVARKMVEFHNAQEAEKARLEAERQKKVEKCIEKGKAPPPPVNVEVEKRVQTDEGNVSFLKKWTFSISDTNKVPREYCCPDEKAIARAVKEGIRSIEGVRIYEETITRRTS